MIEEMLYTVFSYSSEMRAAQRLGPQSLRRIDVISNNSAKQIILCRSDLQKHWSYVGNTHSHEICAE